MEPWSSSLREGRTTTRIARKNRGISSVYDTLLLLYFSDLVRLELASFADLLFGSTDRSEAVVVCFGKVYFPGLG